MSTQYNTNSGYSVAPITINPFNMTTWDRYKSYIFACIITSLIVFVILIILPIAASISPGIMIFLSIFLVPIVLFGYLPVKMGLYEKYRGAHVANVY